MDGFQSLRCLLKCVDKTVHTMGMYGYVLVYMGMFGYLSVYMGIYGFVCVTTS